MMSAITIPAYNVVLLLDISFTSSGLMFIFFFKEFARVRKHASYTPV